MAKVTSKLQVTVPKRLAQRFGIKPGDEIEWEAAGDAIRVVPSKVLKRNVEERLKLFEQATARQQERQRLGALPPEPDRGWTREDLYERRPAR
jgi:AbrB family looped-hinge helix DNA binding protein